MSNTDRRTAALKEYHSALHIEKYYTKLEGL